MNKNWTKAVLTAIALTVGSLPAAFAQSTPGQEAPAPAPAVPAAPAAPTEAPPAPLGKMIYISQAMVYENPVMIAKAVLNECQLPEQGGQLLLAALKSAGIEVAVNDQAVKDGKGRVLQVQISNAVAGGNAFIGHRKQVDVKGQLIENGKVVASFSGMRQSMGGAFGGFKGSCSVLGRCLEALSKDISIWVKNPITGRIGE